MESQPQNPEFRNNPENFHPCICLSIRVVGMIRYMITSRSTAMVMLRRSVHLTTLYPG